MKQTLLLTILAIFLVLFIDAKAQYPFIRHDLNKIMLPADSSVWVKFSKKIDAAKNGGSLRIVHFGDSHIQGDYFTGQVRKHLFRYLETKDNSRGLTMPYRALGTNGPDELFARKEGSFEVTSVRKNMPSIFALSGYCLASSGSDNIVTLRDTSGYRFNKILIFHSPLNLASISVSSNSGSTTTALTDSLYVSVFRFPELQNSASIRLVNASALNKIKIYALSLENDSNKVSYSSVGINGATFGTFLNLYGTKEILKYLRPDCIIFSYGTNDALYRLDSLQLKNQMTSCIHTVKDAIADIPLIFTTPGDHLIHNRKNLNMRLPLTSELIKKTAFANKCGVWDFFNIMGGSGSIRDWYSNQLVFSDGIHLSKKGYRYQGDLFFDALIKLNEL